MSPYAVELSRPIDTLQKAFYDRLADAANRSLNQRLPSHRTPKDLCFAVLREAARIVEEADRGELSSIRNEVRIKKIGVHLAAYHEHD